MGKVSVDDKMRIEPLQKQGLGYHTILAKYPEKNWKLVTIKLICKHVNEKGTALTRKPSEGRPKLFRMPEIIKQVGVGELICLQENQPRQDKEEHQKDCRTTEHSLIVR